MRKAKHKRRMRGTIYISLGLACMVAAEMMAAQFVLAQSVAQQTRIQREIEQQRQRLSSSDIEQRRDALMRLGSMKRPDASRVAATALSDEAVPVRIAAMHASVFLPPAEASGLLVPFLQDKNEFVRREASYALGKTRSRGAVSRLTEVLLSDKQAAVRAAAAVALGEIGDETGVNALSQALSGNGATRKKKPKQEDEFVMRSAARALGQIRSRAGLPALIATLGDERMPLDVRREAATALGRIGDPSAAPSLHAAVDSSDPYLSEAARQALRRLASNGK